MMPIWVWFWESGLRKWDAITANIWCFYSILLGLSPVSSAGSVCCLTPPLGGSKGGHGPAGELRFRTGVFILSGVRKYSECCRMMTVQILIFVDWDKAGTHCSASAGWCVMWMLFCSGKLRSIVHLAPLSSAHPAFSYIRWGLHVSCDEIICRFIEIQVDRHLLGHWPRSPDGGEGRRLSVDCRLIASDGGWPAPGLRNTLAGLGLGRWWYWSGLWGVRGCRDRETARHWPDTRHSHHGNLLNSVQVNYLDNCH